MPRPARFLLVAALATLIGIGTSSCDDGGVFVDSSPGQSVAQASLGWSAVEPIEVDLPTGNPITENAAVPSDSVPILVNIWASWCPPCKKELPLLQEIDAAGQLHVIGFSRDRDEGNAAEALRDAGVTYANWMDSDAELTGDLDGRVPYASVPSSVLIRDGKVIAVHIGEFKTKDDVLKALEQK